MHYAFQYAVYQYTTLQWPRVMGMVSPKHNERRPGAKLVRMFAGLFPHDVLCLLDSHRTHLVRRFLDMKKAGNEIIAQHVLLRQRIRDEVAVEGSLDEMVIHSMFAWFLLERLEQSEPQPIKPKGAIGESPPVVNDAPPLKLWPFDTQKKALQQDLWVI